LKLRCVFDKYPAPLEQVTEYSRKNSRTIQVQGYHLTKTTFKILVFLALKLSWKNAYRLGRLIGVLFYRLNIRRKVAMTNLDIVYANKKSAAEKERIYKASLINFGRVIINYLRLPFMNISFWRDNCHIINEDLLKNALNRKKGAILIGGHIGMMDLGGGVLGLAGYPVALVGKRIKNPALDQFVLDTRTRMNLMSIKHRDSIRRVLKGIMKGETMSLALDQSMKTKQGNFLNWLGRPACSVVSPAFITKKTGAPVIAIYFYQKNAELFEMVFTEKVDWICLPDDPKQEIMLNAQKQADAVQRIIIKHPELWFWIHRRWKVQPPGLKNPYKK